MTAHRSWWVLGGCALALAVVLVGLQNAWAVAGPPAPHTVEALSTPYLLQVEAETLPREWPMQTGYMADASACQYVYSPIQDSGLVTYTFDLSQGAFYIFWGRAMGLGEQQNSFYYALDGEGWAVWAVPTGEGGQWTWAWSRVRSPVWLDAGSHTLALRGREHDTRLDRLEVTTDVEYQPSAIAPCAQPSWTPTPTQTGTPTPTPTLTPTPAIQWFVEAEEGGLVWPMQAHRDEEASACFYVRFASRADLPHTILPCGATGTPSPTPTQTRPAPPTPTATATSTGTATPSPTAPAGWMRRAYLPLVPVGRGSAAR